MIWIMIGVILLVVSIFLFTGGLFIKHKQKRKNLERQHTKLLNSETEKLQHTELLKGNPNEYVRTELLDRNQGSLLKTNQKS